MVNIEEEIELLKREITRLGQPDPKTGKVTVKFGKLVRDDECANICECLLCTVFYRESEDIKPTIPVEAIVGTLRAAKKRKVVAYDGEILLQGPHDNVDVVLL